jgi:hypothetical protein
MKFVYAENKFIEKTLETKGQNLKKLNLFGKTLILGSATKYLSMFNPKNCTVTAKLSEICSGMFILEFRSQIWNFPSRIQGSKKHRIRNTDDDNCQVGTAIMMFFLVSDRGALVYRCEKSFLRNFR